MKQGMAGVAGIMEGMSEPRSSSDLGTVREEEEGEDQENRLSAHASSSTKSPPLFSSQSSNNNNNALLVNVEQEQQGERDFKSLLENKHAKRRSTFDLNWGDACVNFFALSSYDSSKPYCRVLQFQAKSKGSSRFC